MKDQILKIINFFSVIVKSTALLNLPEGEPAWWICGYALPLVASYGWTAHGSAAASPTCPHTHILSAFGSTGTTGKRFFIFLFFYRGRERLHLSALLLLLFLCVRFFELKSIKVQCQKNRAVVSNFIFLCSLLFDTHWKDLLKFSAPRLTGAYKSYICVRFFELSRMKELNNVSGFWLFKDCF